jgi:hypothetical protein
VILKEPRFAVNAMNASHWISIHRSLTIFAGNMVDWATIGASVGLSALGSILLTEYRLQREQSVEEAAELDEWYRDSASYAAEVRRLWQRLFDSPDHPGGNLSELQSELSLLEGQISRHASTGEQMEADSNVIDALDRLATECRKPSRHTLHTNSAEEFQEYREDILDAVEDVEDALNNR